ncbi:MAG TPA: Maf family protein [Anaerolineales bacterium]
MTVGTKILLASNSPRRRELMALGSWTFTVSVIPVDETERPGERPAEYVLRLAEDKARAAVSRADSADVIVAADTTVVDGNSLLGKPRDAAEAAVMLKQLRGRTHQVYTGVAVLDPATGRLAKDVCVTDVPMRLYTDAEIEQYVRSGDPLDKAGAYAIQHAEFQPVANLSGCFASVMGLPLCHLLRLFEKLGLQPDLDVPSRCQSHLHYACPVSAAILRGERVG